jgi:hypothetical protein
MCESIKRNVTCTYDRDMTSRNEAQESGGFSAERWCTYRRGMPDTPQSGH